MHSLHLLEETECIGINRFPCCTAAYDIPNFIILIRHGKFYGGGLYGLIGSAVNGGHFFKSRHGFVIIGVVVVLLKQPERNLQRGSLAVAVHQAGISIPLISVVIG
ncbi:hypothetical protein SDC9_202215 [bioreactor metagenome]|uniref:Uncharacterized protein n=1 Tax=bioreactor metagenome TaxID=1076179 RepID=A0A645J220_9ZZZZ